LRKISLEAPSLFELDRPTSKWAVMSLLDNPYLHMWAFEIYPVPLILLALLHPAYLHRETSLGGASTTKEVNQLDPMTYQYGTDSYYI